jgi:hypothetical protein
MHRFVTAAMAASLALMLSVPAAAASVPAAAPSVPDGPDVRPGRLPVTEVPSGPLSSGQLLREAFLRSTGLAGTDSDGTGPGEPVQMEPVEMEAQFSAWTTPAGDLDGDGVTDVLVYEVDVEWTHVRTTALSGADGAVLWVMDGPRAAWPAGRDLDGEPGDDLVAVSLLRREARGEGCEEDPEWCDAMEVDVAWRVAVLDGATTQTRWQHDIEGWWRYDEDDTGWEMTSDSFSIWTAVTTTPTGPALAVERSGRLRATLTTTSGVVVEEVVTEHRARETVTVELLDGADGTVSGRIVHGPVASDYAWYWPAALRDDGVDDALITVNLAPDVVTRCTRVIVLTLSCASEQEEDYGSRSTLVDGRSLEPRWELEAWASQLGADLDGDGVNDMTTWEWEVWGAPTSTVHSGSTGEPLLSIAGVHSIRPLAADLDGDGIHDLLTYAPTNNENEHGVRVQRRSGRTGALLFETAHTGTTSPGEHASTYASLIPDVGGDGVGDILVTTARYREDPWSYGREHIVEDGATGVHLWSVPFEEGWSYLLPLGDVDGDGAAEVVHVSERDDRITVLDGPTGTPRWALDASRATVVGDVDGDGAPDLLLTDRDDDGNQWVTARSGRTGDVIWQRLIAPPEG